MVSDSDDDERFLEGPWTYSNLKRQFFVTQLVLQKMSKKTSMEKAKELNLPHHNCMKTKQELEKATIKTQHKYKDIIFENDSFETYMY